MSYLDERLERVANMATRETEDLLKRAQQAISTAVARAEAAEAECERLRADERLDERRLEEIDRAAHDWLDSVGRGHRHGHECEFGDGAELVLAEARRLVEEVASARVAVEFLAAWAAKTLTENRIAPPGGSGAWTAERVLEEAGEAIDRARGGQDG